MKIGFEAKRAFNNGTGLGHYSRTLIQSLANNFPLNEYLLYTPKVSNKFVIDGVNNIKIKKPSTLLNKSFSSVWRSKWVVKDLQKDKINLYHGLSHEIPIGIQKTNIKSVVTIHDLIHERYPEQYNPVDVRIYRKKFLHACIHADKVIAISKQTKDDIVEFYKIAESKIEICYQSCNQSFAEQLSAEAKEAIRKKYNLPNEYLLYVGSIIERKNLLNICKAIKILGNEIKIPLVAIGDGGSYKKIVQQYVAKEKLGDKIIFLSDNPLCNVSDFTTAKDFPAIYQLATCMVYPSTFEGFGIPVLEALWSKIPVITSNISCLPEAAGPGAFYVNPYSVQEIAEAIIKVLNDKTAVQQSVKIGWDYAQKFTQQACASKVMAVYQQLLQPNA